MRYDTPIYFQKSTGEQYNAETGDYDAGQTEETLKFASVVGTTENMQQLIYGQLRQNSLTVSLQNKYTGTFSTIRIGDKVYAVDYHKDHRQKQTLVLSEVLK